MKLNARRQRVSPLKDKPLRNPGQSLDEELQRLWDEDLNTWLSLFLLPIIFTAYEWWRAVSNTPPQPLGALIVTIPISSCACFRLYRLRLQLRRLRMARDGEKAVGQYLSDLREKGYRVFHDIVGKGFNVDHVVICDRGIFTIETKTYSKPSSGKSTIHFDGETIQVNGQMMERNAVEQAKAQAYWVAEVLKESTGRSFAVKPVVVFPGWFVESSKTKGPSDLWVLNPKALPSFIDNEPQRVTPEDVKLAAYHLSRYIRTS
ncbi:MULTISPECIES: nuclease-related domain-containing protein [Cyanophyceae]|uniref:NERD domain-containing protein n=1 Tax=Leptolyngbya subtilissima DQ-A4 TaxID=2933933 RepID=A0ABV0K1S8_9CYAN|nr:nuclease-related domain-containing protein [Nodosilinea sp. FACHB-141]